MPASDKVEVDPWLGGSSTALTWLQTAMAQREAERAPVDVDQYLDKEYLTRVTGAIKRIKEILDAENIRLVIAILPMLSRLDDYPYSQVHSAIRDLCGVLEIENVDLLDGFVGLDERDLWVHPTDQHPNHRAHRLIAEGIRAHLRTARPR